DEGCRARRHQGSQGQEEESGCFVQSPPLAQAGRRAPPCASPSVRSPPTGARFERGRQVAPVALGGSQAPRNSRLPHLQRPDTESRGRQSSRDGGGTT